MAKFYVYRIKAGKITIDDVPEKWRAAVEELLAAEQRDERKTKKNGMDIVRFIGDISIYILRMVQLSNIVYYSWKQNVLVFNAVRNCE